jgi:hypothetical protein
MIGRGCGHCWLPEVWPTCSVLCIISSKFLRNLRGPERMWMKKKIAERESKSGTLAGGKPQRRRRWPRKPPGAAPCPPSRVLVFSLLVVGAVCSCGVFWILTLTTSCGHPQLRLWAVGQRPQPVGPHHSKHVEVKHIGRRAWCRWLWKRRYTVVTRVHIIPGMIDRRPRGLGPSR